ncbi:MAG TPA: rhodanese-like domain-containing protein [Candidatus Acidoferrales bacterium]|nr:rhodanese-like domain-containing protein [Candidatus Acidoferrales bacterium]
MNRMKTPIAILSCCAISGLFSLALLSAPAARAQDDLGTSDPTIASSAPVQSIAPADVLKLLQSKDSKFALVDTQPADGYNEGHIPGALNYPWVMRIRTFPIALPRNKTLIFYGSCPNDTSDIVKQLAEFGYSSVMIMDGGWYKWVELKYPASGAVENAPPPSETSQVVARPAKPASH